MISQIGGGGGKCLIEGGVLPCTAKNTGAKNTLGEEKNCPYSVKSFLTCIQPPFLDKVV